MEAERCPDCDHVLATQADYDAHPEGCECERCLSLCWRAWNTGERCDHEPIDWRTRALAYKAALVGVEGREENGAERCPVCDRKCNMVPSAHPCSTHAPVCPDESDHYEWEWKVAARRHYPDPTKGERYMLRVPIRAVQLAMDTQYKGKAWPAGSWLCYDPGTKRRFMVDAVTFDATFLHLTSRHS